MRFLVALLALALVTLPFGMGAMMSHADAQGHEVHAAHAGHHSRDSEAPGHQGKSMDFLVCGACLSVAPQAVAFALPAEHGKRGTLAALEPLRGIALLPPIPPPRA
jgi:hypothetical protein